MFPSLRIGMAWIHTWFGLVLGFILMVAFFFGSLSVFDREIDRGSDELFTSAVCGNSGHNQHCRCKAPASSTPGRPSYCAHTWALSNLYPTLSGFRQ